MSTPIEALIIGAGISGLTAAYALAKSGVTVRVIESAARPGGVIRSIRRDGYLVECGPQSFTGNGAIITLCKDLGILEERVLADPKAARYVLIDGRLQPVPMGPGILTSSFMGGGTRGAILKDILGKSVAPEPDESVAAFMRRKFSNTLLERLVGPFVSGIYAGDPERLSLRSAFPILYESEKARGSIIRGAFAVMKRRKAAKADAPPALKEKPTLQTFRNGNETMVNAIARFLDNRLICNAQVTRIEALPGQESEASRFRVSVSNSHENEIIEAKGLILATPTDIAGKLLASLDAGFSQPFGAIDYAGVAVVSLGYAKQDVTDPLSGFGFLVPRSSGLGILGSVWNSSLFPGRAPDGHALLTSFVGGATNAAALTQSREALALQVHRELTPLLGIRKDPAFSNVTIWPRAIPQYNLGHATRITALNALRTRFPGLYFSGNYLTGPAIGTCVEQALKTADDLRVSFATLQ